MAERVAFDLDLLIESQEGGYRARVLRSPAGDGQEVTFARPFSDLELETLLRHMGRPRRRTRRKESAAVEAAKQFGGQLFGAVFTGEVGLCLRRSVDLAGVADATLRIRLVLSDCPELADIPWEFLYDKKDDWFVALSEATPVVRYLQLPSQPRPLRVTLPLRVLAIRSEPAGSPHLDLEAEWSQVMGSLEQFISNGAIIVTDLVPPTLSELRRVLAREQFHVLHYMGHGDFTAEDGGMIFFTDQVGRATPVTGEQLSYMLRDHTSLRLAVLNACDAGRTDPTDPFGGVADTLVRRGIPAVIAMQFEISDAAAIEFAPALYGALAAGRPVDTAVAEARKAIFAAGNRLEWATPVLHLRADNAHLFDIDQATRPMEEIPPPDPPPDPGFWDRVREKRRVLVVAGIALVAAAVAASLPPVRALVSPHPGPTASPTRSAASAASTASTADVYCPPGPLTPLTLFGSAAFGPIAKDAATAYEKQCQKAVINFQYDQGQSSAYSVSTLNTDVSEHQQDASSMIAMYDGPTTSGPLLTRHPVGGVVIYSMIAHTNFILGPNVTDQTLADLFGSTTITDQMMKNFFGTAAGTPDEVAVGLQSGSGTRQALLGLFNKPADSVEPAGHGCPPLSGQHTCTEYSYAGTFQFVSETKDAIGYVAIYGDVHGQPASYPASGAAPVGYPNLSVITINNAAPTTTNVQNGTYAFAAAENLYTAPRPSALATSFLAYLTQQYLVQHPPPDYLACSKVSRKLANLVSQCAS